MRTTKILAGIVATLLAGVVAIIPEAAMYLIWHLVSPQSEAARIALVAVFVLGGGSLCFLSAWLAVLLWTTVMLAVLE